MGAGTRCGAPGRARRKPGREAGGGAAALSHSRSTRPPLPGAEVTAARDGRPHCLPRRRAEGPPGDGEQVRAGRGRPGRPDRCPWAAGGGDPCARGTRRAARPAPPLPRGGRCPGREPTRGGGALGPPRGLPDHGQVRSWVARSQRGADVGLLKGCRANPGLFSLHRPATPAVRRNVSAEKEVSLLPAS